MLKSAMKQGLSAAAQFLQDQADKKCGANLQQNASVQRTPTKCARSKPHHSPPEHTPQGKEKLSKPGAEQQVAGKGVRQVHMFRQQGFVQHAEQQHVLQNHSYQQQYFVQQPHQQQQQHVQQNHHYQQQYFVQPEFVPHPQFAEPPVCNIERNPIRQLAQKDITCAQVYNPIAHMQPHYSLAGSAGMRTFTTSTQQSGVSRFAGGFPAPEPANPIAFMTQLQPSSKLGGARKFSALQGSAAQPRLHDNWYEPCLFSLHSTA
jgi:hypothetical protein